MPGDADDLNSRFDEASDAFVVAIAGLPDAVWFADVPTQERTVAALVNHVALAWVGESDHFRQIAQGNASKGLTWTELDALNAEHGSQFANADRVETLARLVEARTATAGFIRGLTNKQLKRRGAHMPGEPERSVAEWIEICLIGHPAEHLPGILAVAEEMTGS